MNTTKVLAYILLLTVVGCSSTKKEESNNWKALDAYHDVLAQVYHPLKDSGNVEPAKRLLSTLAEKADSLKLAPLPNKVNNEEMKAFVIKLTDDTNLLALDIKNGAADSVISAKLNPIHDQFHEIHKLWKGGKEHEEHH